jgi:DNA-binding MarR family transcriptional regulator
MTCLRGTRDEVPVSLRAAFEAGGLGRRHIPVLMAVGADGPLSVSQIAERIGLSLATTSMMVGELDRRGLVERTEDERDRRRTLVRLPDCHRAIMESWWRDRVAPIARALARLSPRARMQFMDSLRVVAAEATRGALAGDDR